VAVPASNTSGADDTAIPAPSVAVAAPASAPVQDNTAVPVPSVAAAVQATTHSNDGLDTQGFIYKQRTQAYWKDKPRLDGLGAFSHEQWNLMRRIHFILPHMTDKGQAETPKLANVPHYQTSLSQIRSQVDPFRQAASFHSRFINQIVTIPTAFFM
jgi:hypothetical protein